MSKKSHVASIVDEHGGVRVIVAARREEFDLHVQPSERLIVVPGYRVPEPVPWDMIPDVIARATNYIAEWIRSRNDPDALAHPAIVAYRKRYP